MKKQNFKRKFQKGFTLIEIGIVVLILAVLAVVGLRAYSAVGASKVDVSTYFMERYILLSATQCFRQQGNTYAGCTKALLVANGADTNTPWGGAWASGLVGSVFTITFPVPTAVDGASLTTRLNASTAAHVGVAAYVAPNVVVPLTMP